MSDLAFSAPHACARFGYLWPFGKGQHPCAVFIVSHPESTVFPLPTSPPQQIRCDILCGSRVGTPDWDIVARGRLQAVSASNVLNTIARHITKPDAVEGV